MSKKDINEQALGISKNLVNPFTKVRNPEMMRLVTQLKSNDTTKTQDCKLALVSLEFNHPTDLSTKNRAENSMSSKSKSSKVDNMKHPYLKFNNVKFKAKKEPPLMRNHSNLHIDHIIKSDEQYFSKVKRASDPPKP